LLVRHYYRIGKPLKTLDIIPIFYGINVLYLCEKIWDLWPPATAQLCHYSLSSIAWLENALCLVSRDEH
jgi:hypothetical protein